MLYYLHTLSDVISYFRIFKYVTVRIVGAAGTAFLVSLVVGPTIIRLLSRFRFSGATRYKQYSLELDRLHGERKKKTPTMGGLLIITSIVLSTCLWAIPSNPQVWIALLTVCYMGAIGFIDDFLKTRRHNSQGLSCWMKLFFQMAWIVLVFFILTKVPATGHTIRQLMVPFLKRPLISDMYLIVAFLFIAIVVLGATNAVNLTDGLDGLAIGCTSSAVLAYLIMAYIAGHMLFANYLQVPYIPGSGELSVFCASMLGASLGFLWFNCHPAQAFMGDTGSLALGGGIGIIAVLIKQELVLLFVGGVFVLEALSVILQVGYFKMTGRRIFACAPLHHHFELKKNPWSETQVTVRFWILSIVFALLGVLLLKVR